MLLSQPKTKPMFAAKKAENSGIFSHGTKNGKQKMDPAPTMNAGTRAARATVLKVNKKHL